MIKRNISRSFLLSRILNRLRSRNYIWSNNIIPSRRTNKNNKQRKEIIKRRMVVKIMIVKRKEGFLLKILMKKRILFKIIRINVSKIMINSYKLIIRKNSSSNNNH